VLAFALRQFALIDAALTYCPERDREFMPVETHYVDEGRGAYKRALGVVTSTDLLVTGLVQSQDDVHTPGLKYILYDFTDATDVHIGHETLGPLVELNRRTAAIAPSGVVAIVATNPLLFGLARSWQSLTADLGWSSRVFQGRTEAVSWLRGQMGEREIPCPFLEEFAGKVQ
jgi:hypothetical protein